MTINIIVYLLQIKKKLVMNKNSRYNQFDNNQFCSFFYESECLLKSKNEVNICLSSRNST